SCAHSCWPRAPVRWAHSAAMPATCGVAMLVPEIVRVTCGRGHDECTSTPGAAMSTCPPSTVLLAAEKSATASEGSTAPTAMIDGLFAGTPTKPGLPAER